MSIIVYGPQGIGKGLNAELLRRHFGMRTVHEIEPHELDQALTTQRGLAAFKTGTVLYLTTDRPTGIAAHMRRVVHFHDAMAEINRKNGSTPEITP